MAVFLGDVIRGRSSLNLNNLGERLARQAGSPPKLWVADMGGHAYYQQLSRG